MFDRMSSSDYRKLVVNPALEEEGVTIPQPKKKQKQRTPLEQEIQTDILKRLGLVRNAFFWRENSGFMVIPGQNKDRVFRAGIQGIPDIMGVYKGRAIGIEVKRPGNKQSVNQRAFEERFDACGGIYILCTDSSKIVNQIMDAIELKEGK